MSLKPGFGWENAPTWRELPRRFQSRASGDGALVSPSPRFGSSRGRRVVRAPPRATSLASESYARDSSVCVARVFSLSGCRLPSPGGATSTRDEAPVRGEERQAAAAVDRRRHRLGARNPRPQDRSARRTTADLRICDFPRDGVDFLSSRVALTSRAHPRSAPSFSLTNAARRWTRRSRRLDLELARHREILKQARTPTPGEGGGGAGQLRC